MKYWIHIDASYSEIVKSKFHLSKEGYEGPFETLDEARDSLLKFADEIIFNFNIVIRGTIELTEKEIRKI